MCISQSIELIRAIQNKEKDEDFRKDSQAYVLQIMSVCQRRRSRDLKAKPPNFMFCFDSPKKTIYHPIINISRRIW